MDESTGKRCNGGGTIEIFKSNADVISHSLLGELSLLSSGKNWSGRWCRHDRMG